jgi:uncharacterized membrane protein
MITPIVREQLVLSFWRTNKQGMLMKYAISALVFLLLDGLWLGFVAPSFYRQHLGTVLRMSDGQLAPYWPAAVIVYLALIGGLCVFVLARVDDNVFQALLLGAFYGFVTYATYDFTNLATLAAWNWTVAIVDTCWGMTLCGATAAMTIAINKLFQ